MILGCGCDISPNEYLSKLAEIYQILLRNYSESSYSFYFCREKSKRPITFVKLLKMTYK